jgi:hypothetical protein
LPSTADTWWPAVAGAPAVLADVFVAGPPDPGFQLDGRLLVKRGELVPLGLGDQEPLGVVEDASTDAFIGLHSRGRGSREAVWWLWLACRLSRIRRGFGEAFAAIGVPGGRAAVAETHDTP